MLVVGQSLDDRDEALAGVVASFTVGGALAVALAALIGYGLAATALRPVEAMRSRAERVSLKRGDSGCRCRRRTTRSAVSARR